MSGDEIREATAFTRSAEDARQEWRERIGVRVMHAMTCTHDGDDFGPSAVCVTCFANTQRIGALMERERAVAKAEALREYAERPPCGHAERLPGCGGCDPGAIDFVITDDGVRRPFDPTRDLSNPPNQTASDGVR